MIFGLVFCPLSHTKRGVIGGGTRCILYYHWFVLLKKSKKSGKRLKIKFINCKIAVLSRLRDGQHSPKTRVNPERSSEVVATEGNDSGTNGITDEALTRLNSPHNSQEPWRRCISDCGDLIVARYTRAALTGDDDPPPYSALIPHNHAAWSYEFPTEISHLGHTTACRSETPLERFQQRLTSSNAETFSDRTRTHSLDAIPLTAYGVCKEYPSRSASGSPSPENLRISKVISLPRSEYNVSKKYPPEAKDLYQLYPINLIIQYLWLWI